MHSSLLVPLLLLSTLLLVESQAPTAPTWPAQWHASVTVADGTILEALKDNFIPISASGEYYYDSTSTSACFVLVSPTTGRTTRAVINGNKTVDIIDGPTQSCTIESILSSDIFEVLAPNFLSEGRFTFVAIDYYLRDDVFYETYHWTGHLSLFSLTQIDYWHTVETNAPFRLSWGSIDPIVLEFSNVMAGFDDVPNIPYLFSSPATCSSANRKSETKQRPQKDDMDLANTSGNAWPFQWHANSFYTGNNFGLQSVIGEPTTVPISLYGQYYYDWTNLRECNQWTDAVSGVRTKTLIVNSTFHLVTQATNSCLIVPTSPVNGPLKYEWPTGLSFVDEQLLLPPFTSDPPAYTWSEHFYFDAFNVGPEHSFHYWQTADTMVPLQFLGPVLEIPPYGQSMMVWSQFEIGLNGVDVDDIFSLPSVCKKIGPDSEEWDSIVSNPMIQLQMALQKLNR